MRTSTFTTMVFDSLLAGRSSVTGGPDNDTGRHADGQGWMQARHTLHKRVSTRNDVIMAFGHPQEVTRQDGRQVCVWKSLPSRTPPPMLIVYFDEDDVVVDYRIAS